MDVLDELDTTGLAATPGQQARLAAWSGWGGLSSMFDDTKEDWADLRHQLRDRLSEDDWKAARAGVLNAHYTHPAYVQAIWEALAAMGLSSGHVLDPGCGSGAFVGLAPDGVAMTGVELDPTTARVAAALYPSAKIRNEGYETTPTARLYDGAVGNVPFGDIRLHDPAGNPGHHTIHNHFIVKALSQTKPGGLVAVLTSRYTLDSSNPAARRDMQQKADLLGAIRLPSGAHERVADTKATTDLLVFRVRKDGEEPQPFTWEHARKQTLPGADEPVTVNDHMVANPGRVLGQMRAGHGMYGVDLLVDGPQGGELASQLRDRLQLLREATELNGLAYDPTPAPELAAQETAPTPNRALLGSLREVGDTLAFQRLTEAGWSDVDVPKTQLKELRALLSLRDQTRHLLDMEAATPGDNPALSAARAKLQGDARAYRATYGPLNRNKKNVKLKEAKDSKGHVIIDPLTGEAEMEESVTVLRPPVMSRFFSKDPHYALTRAIEIYDEDTGEGVDAPILTARQVYAHYEPKGADTPADALAISQEAKGRVDLGYAAYLLGLDTPDAARAALGDLVFDAPEGDLVPREAYLSGNVRRKLGAAQAAAADDPSFRGNVEALKSVMPRDLTVADIAPTPGAPWIPPSDHQEFVRRGLGVAWATVTYDPASGWKIEASKGGTAQTAQWGTRDKPATSIFQDLLNNKAIQVMRKEWGEDGKESSVFDPRATEAARAKGEQIEEAFKKWIWTDPDRTTRLVAEYNERFNSLVPRSYDEAGARLRLPGLAETITMRTHQRAAIARMIAEPTTGLFHDVGAGKTLEMVAGVMEQKRLGLISKPMVVVPNHMLGQFEREWLQAYPDAKILAADPADISNKSGRGDFMARVTTSDWDAVLVTEEAFKKIGVTQATRAAYRSKQLDQLDEWMAHSEDQRSVQAAEKKRQSLVNQLKAEAVKAAEKEDPGVVFEQLGVDYLVVDEAHGYKNLSAPTELSGVIASSSAAKVKDLDMKLDWLRKTHGDRVATFATATPIANTMGEMWVMNHFLRPDLLAGAGLDTFDAWAKTFTGIDTRVESTVGGKLTVRQRIARFQNMPELMTMWGTFADVKTRDELNLKIPDVAPDAQGHPAAQVITVDVGPAMAEFQRAIAQRAERIEQGTVEPQEDNWLSITTDGRAMSTDHRLLTGRSADRALRGVTSPVGEQKVDRAADEIARIYHAAKDNPYLDDQGRPAATKGALQLVFADQGTPKRDQWNLYDELKRQLVDRGVPADKIAYAHDAKNSVEKDELFAKARTGAISVLIGSTEKMGTGANMQARAIALHHLTAPWRPADLAQRDGRIIRQGNQNPEVQIYRYVSEGSFDTYMWQTLERKAAFINQVMQGRIEGRDVADADISDEEASYAQVKAIASGNPLIMEEARLKNDVTRFRTRSDAFRAQQRYLREQGTQLDRQADILTGRADMRERLAPTITSTRGQDFRMEVSGRFFTERADAAGELARLFTQMRTDQRTPLRPNAGDRADYTMRGALSSLRLGLGGLTFRIGVQPQERDLNGEVRWDKPVHFTASIDELKENASYWDHGGPTFTLADLDEAGTTIGIIRKLENHLDAVADQAIQMRDRVAEIHDERLRIDEELTKDDPWVARLHQAEDQLAAVHQQMARAETGQETIPGLSSAPAPAPTHGIRTLTSSNSNADNAGTAGMDGNAGTAQESFVYEPDLDIALITDASAENRDVLVRDIARQLDYQLTPDDPYFHARRGTDLLYVPSITVTPADVRIIASRLRTGETVTVAATTYFDDAEPALLAAAPGSRLLSVPRDLFTPEQRRALPAIDLHPAATSGPSDPTDLAIESSRETPRPLSARKRRRPDEASPARGGSTPWGFVDSVEDIAPGIRRVHTDSSVAYWVSDRRRMEMPEALRGDGSHWYHDSASAVLGFCWPQEMHPAADAQATRDAAAAEIARRRPEAWVAYLDDLDQRLTHPVAGYGLTGGWISPVGPIQSARGSASSGIALVTPESGRHDVYLISKARQDEMPEALRAPNPWYTNGAEIQAVNYMFAEQVAPMLGAGAHAVKLDAANNLQDADPGKWAEFTAPMDPAFQAATRAGWDPQAWDREARTWGETSVKVGDRTSWGTADIITPVAPGITRVDTQRHGGYALSHERNQQVPEQLRAPGGHYEDALDARVVHLVFPYEVARALNHEALSDRQTNPNKVRRDAEEALPRTIPDRWDAYETAERARAAERVAREREQRERAQEEARWGSVTLTPGSDSPWGPIQMAEDVAPGIARVYTAGHGGFHLSAERMDGMPPALRQTSAWFEEDNEAALVFQAWPQETTAWLNRGRTGEPLTVQEVLDTARESIQRDYPQRWERYEASQRGAQKRAALTADATPAPQLVPPAHPNDVLQAAYAAPGITTVRTSEGIGYQVDEERNRQIPEPFRDPDGWYPGVVRASAVAMTFTEALKRTSGASTDARTVMELRAVAQKRLREHNPDAWQQWQDSLRATPTAPEPAAATPDDPRIRIISVPMPAPRAESQSGELDDKQGARIRRAQAAAGQPSLAPTGMTTTPTHRPPASGGPSPARRSALR